MSDNATAGTKPPFRKMNWLPRDIAVDRRPDGTLVMQSRTPLQPHAPHLPALLAKWATAAPDRTWIECSWYFPGEDIDPTYAEEFWDLTNSQDWRACELVQRGLTSPHFAPGPFAPNEDAVHQWVQMIGRGYLELTGYGSPLELP